MSKLWGQTDLIAIFVFKGENLLKPSHLLLNPMSWTTSWKTILPLHKRNLEVASQVNRSKLFRRNLRRLELLLKEWIKSFPLLRATILEKHHLVMCPSPLKKSSKMLWKIIKVPVNFYRLNFSTFGSLSLTSFQATNLPNKHQGDLQVSGWKLSKKTAKIATKKMFLLNALLVPKLLE